jgi:uncharacterized membrane protein YqhA
VHGFIVSRQAIIAHAASRPIMAMAGGQGQASALTPGTGHDTTSWPAGTGENAMGILRRVLVSSRYLVVIAIAGTLLASLALLLYEALVVAGAVVAIVREGAVSPKAAKALAVGLIEAVDVFLIAIAAYITSLGLYALFVDDTLPLPRWLQVHDLEDLKKNLVSVVIAVLAVLFLREAVAWDGSRDLLAFGAALALIVASLTFFLARKGTPKD